MKSINYQFKAFRVKIVAALMCMSLVAPSAANASGSREFMMSCTYGVLAGTLVGAATLAFESRPGDKLYKVARGASLGLYAGIALGLYVMYGVPDDDMDLYNMPGLPRDVQKKIKEPPVFALNPILGDDYKLDGAMAHFQVLKF